MFFFLFLSFYPKDMHCAVFKVFTGHFNFDTLQDTLYAQSDSLESRLLPNYIKWGKATNETQKYTVFMYPNYQYLRGSFFIEKMNQDTLNDIVIFIDSLKKEMIDTSLGDIPDNYRYVRDNVKKVILFGQQGIRNGTALVINLTTIDTTQNTPYFVRSFRVGNGLSDPAVRDFSGTYSYIFTPIDLNVNYKNGIIEEDSVNVISNIGDNGDMVIIPNPASNSFRIQFLNCQNGTYIIYLLNLDGNFIRSENIEVNSNNFTSEYIGLTDVPSGKYSVVAQKDGLPPIVRTLIVVH